MDATMAEFVRLCDVALQEAEKWRVEAVANGKRGSIDNSGTLLDYLRAVRQKAVDGTLSPYDGAGLGMGRAVSEWGVEGPIYDAVYDIEEFYEKHM